jgi:phenylalanyl-tRNA synthetase beta chain
MPMTVNTAWLLDYLEPKCSHEDLLDALPRLGLEIEQTHELKKELASIQIGFVRTKEPVAGAPGYHLCEIEVARGQVIPVVCASEHEIQPGWGVPVARAGTTLATGRSIKAAPFHGVRSEGMICLDGELGLVARGSGMHHFTDESLLGAPLTAAIDVPEYLLELNVLPNRPDFLGLIGIARELAALLRLRLRFPETYRPATSKSLPVAVDIREPDLCPRYMCGLVRGVKVAPSPPWLKARLLLAGMRPINNVVDITNYVLYEWGQPLHAFDFQKISGSRIVVRRMAEGETLELLTGAVVGARGQAGGKLFSQAPLVIADAQRPVALAGIMGGRFAETADTTTEVLVEAAHFDPVLIRQTVQQVDLGMESRGTAASYRFERGTDPNTMLEGALGRAVQLIAELAGGTPEGPLLDCYPRPRDRRVLRLGPARTSAYLGMPVDAATIKNSLTRLSMECTGDDQELEVKVPTWRADVNDAVVLIEDVARMVGYDQIPVAPRPSMPSVGLRVLIDQLRQGVSEHLVSVGFYECRNPSLESPQMSGWLGNGGDSITVSNWATREMSVLRRTLLSGLVTTVQTNVRRGAQTARFFEVDRVFGHDPVEPGGGAALGGRWHVAGIAGGRLERSNWRSDGTQVDFFTLKGAVEDLLEVVGARNAVAQPADRQPFVAGTAAEIVLEGKRSVGFMGEIDPRVVEFERVPFRVFAFELDLEALEGAFRMTSAYQQLLRQPAVTRDLAVVVKVTVPYVDLIDAIRMAAGPRLESIRLVDQYQGSQVSAGHQSLAFHMLFRDHERTLTAEEVAEAMDRIVTTVKDRFGAELRGPAS